MRWLHTQCFSFIQFIHDLTARHLTSESLIQIYSEENPKPLGFMLATFGPTLGCPYIQKNFFGPTLGCPYMQKNTTQSGLEEKMWLGAIFAPVYLTIDGWFSTPRFYKKDKQVRRNLIRPNIDG